MDTFTHALTGTLLVGAASGRQKAGGPGSRGLMLAGAAGAVFPDIDFALRLIDTLTYLNWHQGPTHSLVLLPVWGWGLAWLCARFTAGRYRWQVFYLPVCLGLGIHIAGDALTAYGPMLLSPFSMQRYFVPWLYLFDPLFSAIAVIGLIAILLLPYRRATAVVVLILLSGYVSWQASLQRQALAVGTHLIETQRLRDAKVHALPQPPGPFHWLVLVEQEQGYRLARIDLQPGRPGLSAVFPGLLREMTAAYVPADSPQWLTYPRFGRDASESETASTAWASAAMAPFRRFALFPVLDHIDPEADKLCVWFVDLRFMLPALPPSYRFGACRNEQNDEWRLERLRGAFWID